MFTNCKFDLADGLYPVFPIYVAWMFLISP